MNKIKKIYYCIDCGTKIHYNTALYGNGRCNFCSQKGKYVSQETKTKISQSLKGKKLSKITRKKISLSLKGRTFSKAHCVNLSLAQLGNTKMLGKRRSNETRKQLSLLKKGNKNPNWMGGFSPYASEFTKSLKLEIRTRDNFTCQCCGLKEENHFRGNKKIKLIVHHIDYNKQNCKENNLITTCHKCNLKANTNKDYHFAYYTYLIQEIGVI
jgi:DNA-directed RNA polymerase subunit RPC12/RpoP